MKLTKITTALLAVTLSLTLTAATCSKASVDSWSNDAIGSFKAAKPLILAYLPTAGPFVDQGIAAVTSFKTAFDTGAMTAAGYLSSGIHALEDIVAQAPQIKDEATRGKIMAALALADIALNLIANHIQQVPPAMTVGAPGTAVDTIRAFAVKEVWGHAYKY